MWRSCTRRVRNPSSVHSGLRPRRSSRHSKATLCTDCSSLWLRSISLSECSRILSEDADFCSTAILLWWSSSFSSFVSLHSSSGNVVMALCVASTTRSSEHVPRLIGKNAKRLCETLSSRSGEREKPLGSFVRPLRLTSSMHNPRSAHSVSGSTDSSHMAAWSATSDVTSESSACTTLSGFSDSRSSYRPCSSSSCGGKAVRRLEVMSTKRSVEHACSSSAGAAKAASVSRLAQRSRWQR
mmetsp:Transcript_46306/g.100577  ORF Transcript_46306/g.100577 Transcript_46306/m.100577 type:complete len:240 (-) Transcript_46306:1382-2101(-)